MLMPQVDKHGLRFYIRLVDKVAVKVAGAVVRVQVDKVDGFGKVVR